MTQPVTGIVVEFGAWVEGTVAKKQGSGMRKVWTSPAPAGESERLGVFRDGKFVFALHADTPEDRDTALEMLLAAAEALTTPTPAPTPAPKPARKAPTPPAAPAKPTAAVKAPIASLPKPAALTGRVSNPAPAKAANEGQDLLDWLDAVRA